jgi:hypothetical protein
MNSKILNSARTSTQELARLRQLILNGTEEELQAEREHIGMLYKLSDRDYFSKISHYRGEFIVEMRKQYAEILVKSGFKTQEIADFLGLKNHTTICHLLNTKKSGKETEQYIRLNLERFIANSIYPMHKKGEIILVNIAD